MIGDFRILIHSYAGSSRGNVSVLNLDPEQRQVIQMKYTIPFAASHGEKLATLVFLKPLLYCLGVERGFELVLFNIQDTKVPPLVMHRLCSHYLSPWLKVRGT